jgi:hypothetical protein
MPEQYSGQCEHVGGASWLQLTNVGPPTDPREKLAEPLGAAWGTHLNDVNVALGNLVGNTAAQSATYQAERLAEETPAPPGSPPLPELPPPPESPGPPLSVAPPLTPSPVKSSAPPASHKRCKSPVKRHGKKHKVVLTCPKHKTTGRKHKAPTNKHH